MFYAPFLVICWALAILVAFFVFAVVGSILYAAGVALRAKLRKKKVELKVKLKDNLN